METHPAGLLDRELGDALLHGDVPLSGLERFLILTFRSPSEGLLRHWSMTFDTSTSNQNDFKAQYSRKCRLIHCMSIESRSPDRGELV